MIVELLNEQARDIFEEEKTILLRLAKIADGKEVLVFRFRELKNQKDCCPELFWIADDLNPDKKLNDLDLAIDSALEYISLEYEKGKYEGRAIKTLFSQIFEMIGHTELARFNAAYFNR